MLDDLGLFGLPGWLVAVAAVVAVAVVAAAIAGRRRGSLAEHFGLDARHWQLKGSDLGDHGVGVRLQGYGVVGTPDAVFISRAGSTIVIGEAKSRRYRGGVRLHEWYQVVLYMGLARKRWPGCTVRGVLSYRDLCREVVFDDRVFQGLLELRSELIEQRERGWLSRLLGPAPAPLHRRMRVPGPRRRGGPVAG